MRDSRKKCLVCGGLFPPYRPYHKFCDNECRKVAYKSWYAYKPKPTKEKKCKFCSKPFLTNDGKRKYCTTECQLKANFEKRKPKLKRCPSCGNTFKTASYLKKYCKTSCYLKARDKRNELNKVSRS